MQGRLDVAREGDLFGMNFKRLQLLALAGGEVFMGTESGVHAEVLLQRYGGHRTLGSVAV